MRSEEQKRIRKEQDEKLSKQYAEFYSDNQDKIQECKKCKRVTELRNFMSSAFFKNICKACWAAKVKIHRKEKPEMYAKQRYKDFRKSADFIKSFKLNKPCTLCKKIYPPCAMDFNHINKEEKIDSISNLYGKSKNRILAEINKCELICANCHRDVTQSQLNLVPTKKNRVRKSEITDIKASVGDETKICIKCKNIKHIDNFTLLLTNKRHSYCRKCLREYNKCLNRPKKLSPSEVLIMSLKDNKPCTDCEIQYRYWIMDFDHITENKLNNINQLRNRNIQTVENEIQKCELVCANCHKIRTHKRKLEKENNTGCSCLHYTNKLLDNLVTKSENSV